MAHKQNINYCIRYNITKEVNFNKQELPVGILISNIKYDHSGSQNNNPFYLFNDQEDCALAHYFIGSRTIKSKINRFLSNLLIVPLTEKLSYQNVDKWMKKVSEIPWSIPNNKQIKDKFEL